MFVLISMKVVVIKSFILLFSSRFHKRTQEKRRVRIFIITFRSNEQEHFIWGRPAHNLPGVSHEFMMQKWDQAGKQAELFPWALVSWHQQRWMPLMGRKQQWGPLEKVTQQGQMVFIQEFIYLDQLTYEIAGTLTRTCDTSFPWR